MNSTGCKLVTLPSFVLNTTLSSVTNSERPINGVRSPSISLFLNGLKFRNTFEVFWATRGTFEVDEGFEIDDADFKPKQTSNLGMIDESIIGAAASGLTKNVEIPESGHEFKVKSALNCLCVEPESTVT